MKTFFVLLCFCCLFLSAQCTKKEEVKELTTRTTEGTVFSQDSAQTKLPIPDGAITLHYQWFYEFEIVKWQLGDQVFLTTFKRSSHYSHPWVISTIQIDRKK